MATSKHGDAGSIKIESHKHTEPPLVPRKIVRGNRKPMRFVSLHHHSTFSYLDGYQMPDAHVRRANELNMSAMALTEHGNVDSHVRFEAAVDGTGIKPIFGCEVYMPCPWDERGQRKMHLTLLAQDQKGYSNLLHLVSESWDQGFYYQPTVNMERLSRYAPGLIALSGCAGSLLSCSVAGGKGLDPKDATLGRGLKVAKAFQELFDGRYFIEVQAFPTLEDRCRANPILARVAGRLGIRLVGTLDCHYVELDDAEIQKILHDLRPGHKRTSEESAQQWGYDVPLCHPINDATVLRKLKATGLSHVQAIEAIQSTADIAEQCSVTLPKLPIPKYPLPVDFRGSIRDLWREWIRKGWKFRGFDKLHGEELRKYRERLRYEVGLIETKGYENYFLIVSDALIFLKDQDIPVGPARGSAAGSLVAYVLRITEVDPLKFPLLIFERFIDVTREDMPDIDIDLPSEVRDKGDLRRYLEDKYPSVANVSNYVFFKGKIALDDVARVFHVPKYEVEKIKTYLIERSSGDLRASATVQDTIEQFPQAKEVVDKYPDLAYAEYLEGNVRSTGIHAAAYVIADGDIRDVAAVYRKKIKDQYANVVTLDKIDAERQGLLKIDFLGLSTMSAIWQILKWIGWKSMKLYDLPLDDPKVYEAFSNNDVTGIFQFDGRAMRSVCQILKPARFEEIMDCNALSRPGPLHNGAASLYAAIKFGRAEPERFHPAVDVITETTKYQIVYQEQILRIVREVGDFPWTHAAYIRKIISRKIGEQEFNRQWDRFWSGCQTLHKRTDYPQITEAQAKEVWGNMVTSGSYAFNAAHCVAYGLLAYWTMYFKVHHPTEFYAAMAKYSGKDKQYDILRNADRHGVNVLKPRIGKSGSSWKPEGRMRIRAGWRQIESIGPKTAEKIIEYNPQTYDDLINISGIGPKTVASIQEWINQIDPFDIHRLEKAIKEVKQAIATGSMGEELPLPTYKSREIDDLPQRAQIVWLGEMVRYNVRDLFEINQARGTEIDLSKIKDPHLREFAILYARDDEDQTMIRINRYKWPHVRDQILEYQPGHLMLVSGVKPRYGVMMNKLWIIQP